MKQGTVINTVPLVICKNPAIVAGVQKSLSDEKRSSDSDKL